ncbi:MAG: hypothetical protein AAB460_01365 [Patescibacteria group bacterium]
MTATDALWGFLGFLWWIVGRWLNNHPSANTTTNTYRRVRDSKFGRQLRRLVVHLRRGDRQVVIRGQFAGLLKRGRAIEGDFRKRREKYAANLVARELAEFERRASKGFIKTDDLRDLRRTVESVHSVLRLI